MEEIVLEMKSIMKRFPGVLALDDAHLQIRKGEVHILLGENGAGKSTLVKILAGAYSKDAGEILLHGKRIEITSPKHAQDLGICMIYQELNLIQNLSVAENIFLGREHSSAKIKGKIDWKRLHAEASMILDRLQIPVNPRTKVKDLGIAQQQMVEVAKALSTNSRIIIMDEPTAVLTSKEIDTLFETIRRVRKDGVSIVYISHRLEEFEQIGDRVTVMRDARTIQTMKISDTTTDKLISLMVGRELTDKFPRVEKTIGDQVLRVENLNRRGVIKDISFELHRGEILGIAGLVGSGRTEVARAIFGADPIDSGAIIINGKPVTIKTTRDAIKAGLGFVTEDRKKQGLVLSMSVKDNITLSSLNLLTTHARIDLNAEKIIADDFISKLKIRTPGSRQKVMNLSGGNQQKVVLAKWLLSKSKIFIFDEPTRGIDVGAKTEVYHLMNELILGGAAIIMISSELPEILGMSDRVIVMCRGEVTMTMNRDEATQEGVLYYATGGGKYIA